MKKAERYLILIGIFVGFALQIVYDMMREVITEYGTINVAWYTSQILTVLIIAVVTWKLLERVNKYSEN